MSRQTKKYNNSRNSHRSLNLSDTHPFEGSILIRVLPHAEASPLKSDNFSIISFPFIFLLLLSTHYFFKAKYLSCSDRNLSHRRPLGNSTSSYAMARSLGTSRIK